MDPITNFAYSSVTVAPSPATSGTTLEVADVALFPAVGDYNLVVWPAGAFPLASNAEIVRVTAISGSQFTITRAQEGTSARTIVVGDQIGQNVTEEYLTQISDSLIAVGISGNTSGVPATITSGTAVFAGGNNITLSQNGQTITISAGAGGGGVALYDGANSITSGTARFTNANGVSFTFNGQTISGSVRTDYQSSGNYLTTAMASDRGSDFVQATAVFNGTNATGTIASNAISVSVAAQSVQTQNLIAATLAGNTSGALALISSGTMTIAGGNNITVSQAGNAFTISGANAGGAQTAISGIVASDTTYTSGTVSFSNQNGVTIGSSVNGATQYIRLSVASPIPIGTSVNPVASASSVGTVTRYAPEDHRHAGVGGIGISTSGNTAGTTGSQVGTYWFEGGNSVTVSQITSNNGSHTLRLSVGNYLTTAMASNRGSDFVQATAVFNGTNASGTIASGAISVSVAAPTPIGTSVNPVASASSVGTVTRYAPEDHRHAGIGGIGISTSGNTAGTTGSVVGTYWFEGGNSITVSQITSNNGSHTLRLSVGNYITTAMASNRGSDFVQATAVFNGTNASGTIASGAISVSVAAPIPLATTVLSVASANSVGTVTRYAAEDHRHAGVGGVGISTSGGTSGTTGSVIGTYWFQGGNNITVSQITSNNGSHTLVISGANAGGAQTAISGIVVSDTTYTSGTVSFSAQNAITIGSSVNGATQYIRLSVASPIPIGTSVQPVASVSSVGTITRYAPEDHQHAGVAAYAITNTGNTLGNTRSNVGTFYLAASGAITASQSTGAAGNDTLWVSVASQTNQTLGLYAVGNTTSSTTSGTVDARSLSFNGAGNVSVGFSNGSWVISGGSAAPSPVNFSAGTTSGNLGSVVFSDSNGISFGLNGSTITASASTVGTATTYYPVASANSVGTVTRWAAEDHRHAGIGGLGISTAGNSSGTSGSQVGTYWLQGGNNITISQITSNNGSHTAIISGPPNGTASMWPYPLPGSTAISTLYSGQTSQGAGGGSTRTSYTFSLYCVPMVLPVAVAFSELRHGLSMNTAAGTGSVTHLVSAGIYSKSEASLSLVNAFYGGLLLSQNSQTSQTFSVVTYSTGGATAGGGGGFGGIAFSSIYSRAVANMSSNSQVYGRLQFLLLGTGASTSLSAGQYYYVLGYKSVSSGANVLSNVGHLMSNAITSQAIPDMGRENNTQTSNYLPVWGAISTTFTSQSDSASWFALPVSFDIGQMTLSDSSAQRFHFPYLRNLYSA